MERHILMKVGQGSAGIEQRSRPAETKPDQTLELASEERPDVRYTEMLGESEEKRLAVCGVDLRRR